MKKILVTGGSGYIGSVMIPMLIKEGHHVICLDNLMYNQSTLLDHCHLDSFEFVRGDVRDENKIKELVKKVDVIFPLASFTGAGTGAACTGAATGIAGLTAAGVDGFTAATGFGV